MRTYSEPRPTEAPSKTVMLVEDEPATMRFYLTGLRGMREYRVLSATNGAQALAQIQAQPVDVVVTDLRMPVLDGYSLLAILGEKYPSLPVIVLTAVSDPRMLDRAIELGALRVLAKPIRLSLLMEEIRTAAAMQPQGEVRGLPLSSLLQLLNWERKTATLTVRGPDATGYLYVRDGELIHAACEQDEGPPAAQRILGWEGSRVEFVSACRVKATMVLPITELLLEAAIHKDHKPRPEQAPTGVPTRPEPWYD
jgi:CheY-like chemotaxis protein